MRSESLTACTCNETTVRLSNNIHTSEGRAPLVQAISADHCACFIFCSSSLTWVFSKLHVYAVSSVARAACSFRVGQESRYAGKA